jgi:hypothetical protein
MDKKVEMVWYIKTGSSKRLEKIRLFENTGPKELFKCVDFIVMELEAKFITVEKTIQDLDKPIIYSAALKQKALTIKT